LSHKPLVLESLAETLADEKLLASEEARQLVQERDSLTGKIRFGLVALNGGSLLAMLGIASGENMLSTALGFTPNAANFSFIAFVIGVVFGGICLFSHQNEMIVKAGITKARVQSLMNGQLILRPNFPPERDQLKDAYKELESAGELKIEALNVNYRSIVAQNLSAGAWLAGLLAPVLSSPSMLGLYQAVRTFIS